jgi:hypothetical protein
LRQGNPNNRSVLDTSLLDRSFDHDDGSFNLLDRSFERGNNLDRSFEADNLGASPDMRNQRFQHLPPARSTVAICGSPMKHGNNRASPRTSVTGMETCNGAPLDHSIIHNSNPGDSSLLSAIAGSKNQNQPSGKSLALETLKSQNNAYQRQNESLKASLRECRQAYFKELTDFREKHRKFQAESNSVKSRVG